MADLFPNFDGFRYSEPILPREAGVTRRDPSVVLRVQGRYHVWYSKNFEGAVLPNHGFTASIWHAVSEDGHTWEELGEALPRGEAGRWDACGVFTPTVFTRASKVWMLYTAMPEQWVDGQQTTRGAVGLAVAYNPYGPWARSDFPAITCSEDPGAFDSLRVDDACVVLRDDEVWVYYKGRQWDRPPTETKMGLAIAKHPDGPFVKQPENPVLDSGHEVCVWPHAGGVAALVCDVGPQGNTLQFSEDGRQFTRVTETVPPMAPGPFRDDLSPRPGAGAPDVGITWGVSMVDDDWPYLVRFDTNLTVADQHAAVEAPR